MPQPAPASPAESASDRALRERAQGALRKQLAGKPLSTAEVNALAKWEKVSAARRRADAYQHCSGEDLRAMLGGISRAQMVRLAGYGQPRNGDGTYSLFLSVPFYIEHERRRLKAEQAPAISALEQTRLLELEKRRRADAVERGELLPRALAESEAERAARELAAELLGWASSLAPKLAGQDHRAVAAVLNDAVRRVLARLAGP